MASERASSPAHEQAYQEAAEAVHARLALLSCAIWTFGVLAVFLFSPERVRDLWSVIAAVVLLVPAALLWLARPRLVAAEMRRRVAPGRDVG